MNTNFINVHEFDGKLNGKFIQTKIYTIEEKKELFIKLIDELDNKLAIDMVNNDK